MVIPFVLGDTMMTREEIVREHDTLLNSYARFCEVGRQSPRMVHVENALVTLVRRNIEAQPARIVAVAGVSGALAALDASQRMLPSPQVEYRCRRWMESKVEAARQAAEWLCRQTPGCVWLFLVPRRYVEAHKHELLALVDVYFPPPCMEAYKLELLEVFEQYEAKRRLGHGRPDGPDGTECTDSSL